MNKIAVCILIILAFACGKKNRTQNSANNPVPSLPVNISLYPNDPLNFKVQALGGWMYLTGGINGILLYRKSDQEFVAIERTSSYLPDNAAAKIKVMADNFTLQDTVSGSRWRIFDGSVTQGAATWSLRLYGTSYDGNILRIIN